MYTLIFQAAKLGDPLHILDEMLRARKILEQRTPVSTIYGLSGGALTALAFALAYSAQNDPRRWGAAESALDDFYDFLRDAKSRNLRRLNPNPWYGVYNLAPLRTWLTNQLRYYAQAVVASVNSLPDFADLAIPLYLCAMDRDGTFTAFGPPNPDLKFHYHAVQVGPPKVASMIDAVTAALSTVLSTEPTCIGNDCYRDCRPAIVNAAAIVSDLHRSDPSLILRNEPHAPIRPWKRNWITSSFIMHSQNERNQALLAETFLDLKTRLLHLEQQMEAFQANHLPQNHALEEHYTAPILRHVDLPYIGSTEANTNMRQSVENKSALMQSFRQMLAGQLDGFPFHQPANIIYGAGGFSGILAGLVTTRAVDAGFASQGGEIQQIYGVSAGVLNGFFHAVQVAAKKHPDRYTPAAQHALADLETFIAQVTPKQIARLNLNPFKFWQGWGNLGPLEKFLLKKLGAYTGSNHPERLTFDDLQLPMTVCVARLDGFTDFLGMTTPQRSFWFGGQEWIVKPAPVVRALIAGWSMNTYILPTQIEDQSYTDGGGTFYDAGLFVALCDAQLTNLLNIHLDEPEGHSYNLPPRPNLMRILFDTHNYVFPEERRRMRALCDALYHYYTMRHEYAARLASLPRDESKTLSVPEDFRQQWRLPPNPGGFPALDYEN